MFKRLPLPKITITAALSLALTVPPVWSPATSAAMAADFSGMTALQLTAAAQTEWKHKRCEKATAICDELIPENQATHWLIALRPAASTISTAQNAL